MFTVLDWIALDSLVKHLAQLVTGRSGTFYFIIFVYAFMANRSSFISDCCMTKYTTEAERHENGEANERQEHLVSNKNKYLHNMSACPFDAFFFFLFFFFYPFVVTLKLMLQPIRSHLFFNIFFSSRLLCLSSRL